MDPPSIRSRDRRFSASQASLNGQEQSEIHREQNVAQPYYTQPQQQWLPQQLQTHGYNQQLHIDGSAMLPDNTSHQDSLPFQQETLNALQNQSGPWFAGASLGNTSLPFPNPLQDSFGGLSGQMGPRIQSSSSNTSPSSYPSFHDQDSQLSLNMSNSSGTQYTYDQSNSYHHPHGPDTVPRSFPPFDMSGSQQKSNISRGVSNSNYLRPPDAGEPRRKRRSGHVQGKAYVHNNSEKPSDDWEKHLEETIDTSDRSTRSIHHPSVSSGRSNRGYHRRKSRSRSRRRAISRPSEFESSTHYVDKVCNIWIAKNAEQGCAHTIPTLADLQAIAHICTTEDLDRIRNYIMARIPRKATESSVNADIAGPNRRPSQQRESEQRIRDRIAIAEDYRQKCKTRNCHKVKGYKQTGATPQADGQGPTRLLWCLRRHPDGPCPRVFHEKESWKKHLMITDPQVIIVCSVNQCNKPMWNHLYEHYRSHVNSEEITEEEIPWYRENDVVISKPPFKQRCGFCKKTFDDWDSFHNDVYCHFVNDGCTMNQWSYVLDASDSEQSDVERHTPDDDHHSSDSDDEDGGDDDNTPTGGNTRHNRDLGYGDGNRGSESRSGRSNQNSGSTTHHQYAGGSRYYQTRSRTWSPGSAYDYRSRSQFFNQPQLESGRRRRSQSLNSQDRLALRDINLFAIGAGIIDEKAQNSDLTENIEPSSKSNASGDGADEPEVENHFEKCQKAAQDGAAASETSWKASSALRLNVKCPFLSQLQDQCASGPWTREFTHPKAYMILAEEILFAPQAEDVGNGSGSGLRGVVFGQTLNGLNTMATLSFCYRWNTASSARTTI